MDVADVLTWSINVAKNNMFLTELAGCRIKATVSRGQAQEFLLCTYAYVAESQASKIYDTTIHKSYIHCASQ